MYLFGAEIYRPFKGLGVSGARVPEVAALHALSKLGVLRFQTSQPIKGCLIGPAAGFQRDRSRRQHQATAREAPNCDGLPHSVPGPVQDLGSNETQFSSLNGSLKIVIRLIVALILRPPDR